MARLGDYLARSAVCLLFSSKSDIQRNLVCFPCAEVHDLFHKKVVVVIFDLMDSAMVKPLLSFLACICLANYVAGQSVGIGTTNPAPSAQLDVSSINKGFLPPRMTTIQRDSIRNPSDGLIIFNTTTGSPNYFYAGSWFEFRGTAPLFPGGTVFCSGTPTTLVTVVNPITGRTWMDRNLGASQAATDSSDSNAFGDLYQWGRSGDGHQCRTSATSTSLSSADQPGNTNFIIASTTPFDWRSPQNNSLWQGVNGINNPCPSGFRLPTEVELNEERLSWSSQNAAGAIQSPLKWSKAGVRSFLNGALSLGTRGSYWTSTISGTNARSLVFSATSADILTNQRANGYSVRCIRQIDGAISSLNCATARTIGTLTNGTPANNVSIRVPYTGGNAGVYTGQTVNSTGVTGLTATLSNGSFVSGNDSLTYQVSGTPTALGTASFAISVGGQTCSLTVEVVAPSYPPGTVICPPGIPTDVVEVTSTTGKIWMDRNLGASQVAASASDVNGFGDLYQWGRAGDGHQCRSSATTSTLSSSNQPGHGDFILATNTPNDWRSPQENNLWQGVNGINNPCPTGFRIPTEAEWAGERATWNFGPFNFINAALNSPLRLGNPGVRNATTGAIASGGNQGLYWSSTISAGNVRTLFIQTITGTTASITTSTRATGATVRCIKEIAGTITALNCNNVVNTGTITAGTAATGASSSIPYTGGNAGTFDAQSINSTGVTGLTASLGAGSFANGNGTLTFTITGTAASSGTANFALSIGGQSCSVAVTVFAAGTIQCTGSPTPVVTVTSPTGKVWMDRNLGASRAANSVTDSLAYGELYQWGRRSDGHQCRNASTTTTLSSSDQPANGNFILSPAAPADWRSPQNINLWQGVDGINNPCPTGFRLPLEAELQAEWQSWGGQHAAGAFASPLKFTLAGSRGRSTGALNDVGVRGLYWTSTVIGTSSRSLSFYADSSTMFTSSRAVGASVRCIQNLVGTISSLACSSATNVGYLEQGKVATGVSSSIPYTGGNGGAYSAQSVASTGVSGLTANLAAGLLANGNGTLVYTISGTPSSRGLANFAINIGGQSCTISLFVNNSYPTGTIHCNPAAPTTVVDVVSPATGRTWMDRNLGAANLASSFSDFGAFGDLYQWGRRADGHQCRTSNTTTTLSTVDQPTHGDFIIAPSNVPNWRTPENTNLWQGSAGINNPCPTGYRLPTAIEWNNERVAWGSNPDAASAYASFLKLPIAGYRTNTGQVLDNSQGEFGYYWSSSWANGTPEGIVGGRIIYMDFGVAEMEISNPILGISVRCIRN